MKLTCNFIFNNKKNSFLKTKIQVLIKEINFSECRYFNISTKLRLKPIYKKKQD